MKEENHLWKLIELYPHKPWGWLGVNVRLVWNEIENYNRNSKLG